jgi:hypothetical protein
MAFIEYLMPYVVGNIHLNQIGNSMELSDDTIIIPATLPNGTVVRIQARRLGGREQVGITTQLFSDLTDSIQGIVEGLAETLKQAKPKKATIQFGIEASIESGKLVAILCNGEAKANLKMTLEWSSDVI